MYGTALAPGMLLLYACFVTLVLQQTPASVQSWFEFVFSLCTRQKHWVDSLSVVY